MPKTKISEYSVTNSSNTDIEGINIDEGCAPSGINNAIRELMVHLKEFQTGASGDAFTFAGGVLISGTANTITGNVLMSGTNTITGSTTATFAAGAVGTPSIAAHGDTNTGIFFPAADTIAFAEGGAEALRINSSGQSEFPDGTVSLPSVTNSGDTNTGVYFPAADEVAVAAGGSVAAAFNSHQFMGMRNRIINGDMRIDQRNDGASVTATASFPFSVDRWWGYEDGTGSFTMQRSTTAPTGFTNSVVLTVSSADTSLGAAEQYIFNQSIEGLNVSDLGWGTANAKTVTLSFWVRSSVTGTYPVAVINSASNRSYVSTYTISSANTFEYKTITIPGDTSGTWLTDNGIGLMVRFSLGAGSDFQTTANQWNGSYELTTSSCTNLMATNGATWYITGVQLEVGSVATPFERRPYGTELALCQRYYFRITGDNFQTSALGYTTTICLGNTIFPVIMRAAPTALEQSGTASDYIAFSDTSTAANTAPTFERASTTYAQTRITVASGLTAGRAYFQRILSPSYYGWSAEL